MADYPVTPSFGFIPGQPTAMPSYSGTIPSPNPKYGSAPPDQVQTQAFDYNQAQAMAALMQSGGFPGFSAAAVASGVPPLPIYPSWDPLSYPPRVHSASQVMPAVDRTGDSSTNGHLSTNRELLNKHHARDSWYPQPLTDEGELSEGEYEGPDTPRFARGSERTYTPRRRFDDEYQREYDGPVRVQQSIQHQKHDQRSQDANGETDIYGRSLDLSRQRSESYSPHISPVQTARAPTLVNSRSINNTANSNNTSVSVNGLGDQSGLKHISADPTDTQAPVEQSLREARKEAQSAILNLWPFKVRLEHYLEEGIDEAIVRQQFSELGMLPTNSDHKHPDSIESEISSSKRSHPPTTSTLSDSNNIAPKEKVEERKDRIARLLAEKSKKLSAPTQSENSADAKSAEANVINSAKADKEKLLRQKMEALQKSREARALKAAAAKTSISVSAPNTTSLDKDTLVDSTKDDNMKVDLQKQTSAKSQPLVMSTSTSPSVKGVTLQNAVSIPGLFLSRSTSNTPSVTSIGLPVSGAPVNQRKRPVASDFDSPTHSGPYKRLFGHSRNDQPLVIDVSDEESDDGAEYPQIEADDQTDNTRSQPTQTRANAVIRTSTMRDLPPLSDFPRKVANQGSTSSSPQTPSANKIAGKPEDLQRKELEIQELRRKITLIEQRKRAKKDLSNSQNVVAKSATSNTKPPTNQMSISDKIEASVQIEQLMQDANRQLHQDQEKVAQTKAIVTEQFAELNGNEIEQRRLRRAKIVADLPLVDAEVEASQKKLAELRAEMDKLEAAVSRGLDNKRRLAEEMEKLGREAEDQLQEQKDKLKILVDDEPPKNDAKDRSNIEEMTTAAQSSTLNRVSHVDLGSPKEPLSDQDNCQAPQVDSVASAPSSVSETTEPLVEKDSPGQMPDVLSSTDIKTRTSPSEEHDNSQSLDAALQNAIASAEAESMAGVGSDSDMQDLCTPNSNEPSPLTRATSSNPEPEDVPMNEDTSSRGDGDSDHYEPPEATPPVSDDVPMSMDSPPFSPAPPETAQASGPDTPAAEVPGTASPFANVADAEPRNLLDSPVVTKRSAPYNGSSKPRQWESSQNILGLLPSEERISYTSYKSPLKWFRAFRFHPNFIAEVPGGFKSLTYSNNINPNQEICRYELAGGICNDNSCEFQHFKTMGLADDAILVELGNSAGYSEADKPKFISGLRNVLQDLRKKKTKDFKVIAAEIAAYRTRFLNDKSKVLLLEDVSI